MPKDNRCRSAEFIRIVDGDTFIARMIAMPTVEPKHLVQASIRVYNWNAAEMNEPEGAIMRDKFARLLSNASTIDLELRGMSYHRIVCSVFLDGVLFAGILHEELQKLRGVDHGRIP